MIADQFGSITAFKLLREGSGDRHHETRGIDASEPIVPTKMEPTLCYGFLSRSAGRASVFLYTGKFGEQRHGASRSIPAHNNRMAMPNLERVCRRLESASARVHSLTLKTDRKNWLNKFGT